MSLTPGTKLGSYEITERIGAGGMGEVFRARDIKLGREVAIKVLPEEFAKDRERLTRFEREARLLASLNHPHIATIHGLETVDGTNFLVMELVPGETLAVKIARGPISLGDALRGFANYDVSPDGQSFAIIRNTAKPGREIRFVQNWIEEVKRLVPVGN